MVATSEPGKASVPAVQTYRDPYFWTILTLAALLLFWSLDARYLWQDEAETALLGKNILRYGVPIAGDGTNVVSQEASREFIPDPRWHPFLWRWSPWVQFYVAAASFLLFGPSTLAARLPFTLLGFLTVPLTYALARRLFDSLAVARLSALFLTLSDPFLLHTRQARWCAPAYLLLVLFLLSLLGLRYSRKGALVGCVVTGFFLFHTNYFVAIGTLLALLAAAPLLSLDPGFLKRMLVAYFCIAVLTLPWLAFFDILGKTITCSVTTPTRATTSSVRRRRARSSYSSRRKARNVRSGPVVVVSGREVVDSVEDVQHSVLLNNQTSVSLLTNRRCHVRDNEGTRDRPTQR